MDQVRFGIIGIGTMGSNHAKWMEEGKMEGQMCLSDLEQWQKENEEY